MTMMMRVLKRGGGGGTKQKRTRAPGDDFNGEKVANCKTPVMDLNRYQILGFSNPSHDDLCLSDYDEFEN